MKIIVVSGTGNSQVQEMVWSLWKKVLRSDLRASTFWVTATSSLFCEGDSGQLPYLFHRSPSPTENIITSQETNETQNGLAQLTTNCCSESLYQTAIFYHHPHLSGHRRQVRENSAVNMSPSLHRARHHASVLLCHYRDRRIRKYPFWNPIFKLRCPGLHNSLLTWAFNTILP